MSTTHADRALAFVAEAERMTNERDIDGIREIFAPNGRQTATIDGLLIRAEGIDEVHAGFLDARPQTSPVQGLRMLLAHPRTAVAFARSRLSGRR